MFNNCKLVYVSFLLLFSSVWSFAQEIGIRDDVMIGRLDNGLKYYIHPNAKPSKKLELRLIVNAGSMQETDAQRGLAHFIEHLMFNGTKSYPKNTLVDKLETMGIAFGADLNAMTSFDETIYILPIPTENKANVEEGFKILKEWAGDALLLDEDIDEERKVILEESRLYKSADRRFYEKYFPQLFNYTRYAERLPIGIDSIIQNAPYQEFKNFYKEWYRPNLMAVVAVGDITFEEGEALIKKYFGDLTNPQVSTPRATITIPPYEKSTAKVLTDKEASSYEATIYFSVAPTPNPKSIQTYRANLLKGIFQMAINRRLAQIKEQEEPPYASAGVYLGSLARENEGLVVSLSPTEDMNIAITAVMTELNRMLTFGISPEELEQGKKALFASAENQLKERNLTSSSVWVDQYVSNFLNQTPIEGPELRLQYLQSMMPSVDKNEVDNFIKSVIKREQTFFATITGPDTRSIKLPTDREVVKLIETALQKEVTPYEAPQLATSLVDVTALKEQKGSILNTTHDSAIGTTYYELSNGLKVALKTTNFKNDEIVFKAENYGGASQYLTSQNLQKENAFFVSNLIDMLGYGDFTPTQLNAYLTGKRVSVRLGMGEISNYVGGASSVADLETLFQLIHLKMTSLRKDEALLKGTINTFKLQLENLRQDPQMVFLDTISKVFYNNNPLAPLNLPTVAMLSKISMDSIAAIYDKEFKQSSSRFFYTFVGNIDEALFKEYITTYLATLPTATHTSNWVDNGLRPAQGYTELNYFGGVEEKALLFQTVHGKIDYSPDLYLKANMLVDILNFKVIEEIREKMGAIYGGGFSVEMSKYPHPYYQLSLQMPCGPQNVDTIMSAINHALEQIKKEGVSQKDLDKVITNYQENYRVSLESNRNWLSEIINMQLWEKDKERFLNYKSVLSKITTSDIKATANLLFGGVNSNIFIATMYPEAYSK